ncbi:MAG: YkvA family protein [Candidatus Promineifilaceae bacterium]
MRWIPSLVNPNFWRKTWYEMRVGWQLLRDGRVPLPLKVLPVLIILYLLSPLDLIPGFLPVVGQLDDLGLLLIGLSTFIRLAPPDVVAEYRARLVDESPEQQQPVLAAAEQPA